MADIARLYDFTPATTIKSSEVDDELNQIVATIDDLDDDNISASAEIAQSKISNTVKAIDADKVDGFNANATPTASTLLPLDSDKNFPISVIKDGTFPIAKLKIYDSERFAIVTNTTYIKDHGLGVVPKLFEITVTENADGTGWFFRCPVLAPVGYQTAMIGCSTTQIKIRTAESLCRFVDANGAVANLSAGFCRIIAVA